MISIFIGNLPFTVTEADLVDCFAQFGAVERVSLVRDRETGNSRGYAFIEMTHERDGMLALQELNGCDWAGRRINVALARERSRFQTADAAKE